jgi:hypothetical protein
MPSMLPQKRRGALPFALPEAQDLSVLIYPLVD